VVLPVVAGGLLARQPYFRWVLARHGTSKLSLRRIAVVAALTGWFVTTSLPLFSSFLGITDTGLLTMIVVCWVSLAVSMLAVDLRVYTAYLLACMLTIYLSWARYASLEDMVVMAVAMGLGVPIMIRLARTLKPPAARAGGDGAGPGPRRGAAAPVAEEPAGDAARALALPRRGQPRPAAAGAGAAVPLRHLPPVHRPGAARRHGAADRAARPSRSTACSATWWTSRRSTPAP
jgi:hypothetical protein